MIEQTSNALTNKPNVGSPGILPDIRGILRLATMRTYVSSSLSVAGLGHQVILFGFRHTCRRLRAAVRTTTHRRPAESDRKSPYMGHSEAVLVHRDDRLATSPVISF